MTSRSTSNRLAPNDPARIDSRLPFLANPVWRVAFALLLKVLSENHRRWFLGLLSIAIGYGGDKRIATLAGCKPETVARGRHELQNGLADAPAGGRVRRKGGGRKPVEVTNPQAEVVLLEALEHETIGDPTGGKPMTRLGTGELTRRIIERTGKRIGDQTVRRLLKKTATR